MNSLISITQVLEQFRGSAKKLAVILGLPQHENILNYVLLLISALLLFSIVAIIIRIASSLIKTISSFGKKEPWEKELARQKKTFSKQAKQLAAEDKFEEAAELCEQIQDFEGAAGLYIKAGRSLKAAGMYEEAGKFMEAADLYKAGESFSKAAELYEKAKDYAKAAAMYGKSGIWEKATSLYEKADDNEHAAWSCEQMLRAGSAHGMQPGPMQKLSLRCGQYFEKAGNVGKAVEVFGNAGLYMEAAKALESVGNFLQAAEYYIKGEDYNTASDMFLRGGDKRKHLYAQGKFLIKAGRGKEAIDLFEKSEEYEEAAEVCLLNGDTGSAAGFFFRAGRYNEAGEHFVKSGNYLQAAEAYEKAHMPLWAAQVMEKNGKITVKTGELYEQADRSFEAGRVYRAIGMPDRAIRALQKVEGDSEYFRDASLLLAETLMDMGMMNPAIERLKKVMAIQQGAVTIDALYLMGRCEEGLGNREKALAIYEKILSEDYDYRDTRDRIDSLNRKIN